MDLLILNISIVKNVTHSLISVALELLKDKFKVTFILLTAAIIIA